MIQIVILYALFAATFSLGKCVLGYTQPMFLVGSRMTIAGLLLLGYQWFTNRKQFSIKKSHMLLFAQVMLFTIYVPYLLRFWGLNYMSSSKACLIYNLSPFMTFIFSYFFRSEKITFKKVAGLFIGFFGLLPMICKSECPSEYVTSVIGLPELAMVISITSMSYGWLLVHKLVSDKKYAPAFANGISMTGGGVLALCTSFIFEKQTGFVSDLLPFIGILAIIIIVSNLICHNLYATLLRRYSPTLLSFASFLSPLFAALYGWIFLKETISLQFAASSVAVFIGLTLFYKDELREGRQQNQTVIEPVEGESF